VTVGSLEVQLRLEGCRSLKEKRRVLRPLIERLRRDLHASVAETDDHDLWNAATIGIAVVGTNRTAVEHVLDRAEQIIDEHSEVRTQGVLRDYS
jgi:uncharacterized protein YlxP (DUF503 family)